MALTKKLTQLWPIKQPRNFFRVGFNLELKDGEEVVIDNEPITADYNNSTTKAVVKERLKAKAQKRIDKYIAEKKMNTTIANTGVVGEIGTELDLTE